MAKCDICGKGVTFGIKVSHSHRRTNRTWKPNVKRVKAIVKGTPCHIYACSRCLSTEKYRAFRYGTLLFFILSAFADSINYEFLII